MLRPALVPIAAILLFLPDGHAQQRRFTDGEVSRIHKSLLLIDTHNDVTGRTVSGFDIGQRSPDGNTDLPRLLAGGIGAQFFAVYVDAQYDKENHSARRALEMADTIRHDIIARCPDRFELALTAGDIEPDSCARQNRRQNRSPYGD